MNHDRPACVLLGAAACILHLWLGSQIAQLTASLGTGNEERQGLQVDFARLLLSLATGWQAAGILVGISGAVGAYKVIQNHSLSSCKLTLAIRSTFRPCASSLFNQSLTFS